MIERLVEYFEEAEETTQDARGLSERDRDYYDGNQLTEEQMAALRKRGQPPVVYNFIKPKVNFMLGMEKAQRKDPKVFPRTPDDEMAAQAATDALRYACDLSNWDKVRSAAWKNILIEGTGAVMVGVKMVKSPKARLQQSSMMTPPQMFDPTIQHIKWDRFFYDPKSADNDFADARYTGIVTWYDFDVASKKWPDKEDVLSATMSGTPGEETYEDRPRHKIWAHSRDKRVRVCEIYHIEDGVWLRSVFTERGLLEESAPSPYLDEYGEPENPILAVSLYVDRENNRYGDVRSSIDASDEVNKRRSKGLHLISMRQFRRSPSAISDKATIKRELANPQGGIEAEPGDFEILPTHDMAQGNFELMQDARAFIDGQGANTSMMGKNRSDMSGKAINAQQQGGMVEATEPFDAVRELSLMVYRALWNRIRQVWTSERWLRVTSDDRYMQFVGLNQQVTVKMLAAEVAEQKPEAIALAAKIVGPQLLQAYMQGDPNAQMQLGMFVQQHGDQVVEVRNAINELDVDITIDEGLDNPTVMAEQFEMLAKMINTLPPDFQMPMFELLFESSALRDKDKIRKMFAEMKAGPSPEEQQLQQQMQGIQMAGAVAEVEKTQSEAAKNMAQAQMPVDPDDKLFRAAELETDQFEAVTNRIQALTPDHV